MWLLKCIVDWLLSWFFFWGGGGFLLPSMWRQIHTVSVLVCGAQRTQQLLSWIAIIYLKTPFSLSAWSECWESQLGNCFQVFVAVLESGSHK